METKELLSVSKRLYCYGTDGIDDQGWGCVYRSVQNVMSHCGLLPVIDFETVIAMCGRVYGSWAEPADCLDIFPSSISLIVGNTERLLKYTKMD